MCNILITGAGGFIGRALVRELVKTDAHVYALDIKPLDGSITQNVKGFFCQDLGVPFLLDVEFDYVFHLGAYNFTHAGSPQADQYQRVNVLGTENLINSSRIKNFIFLSTSKVYKTTGMPIDEEAVLDPSDEYAKSKLEAEKICRTQFRGKNLCIFRSVNISGPGQAEKAVIPVLFKQAMSGEALDIFAPKKLMLQFVCVNDIIQLFKRCIELGGVDGVFNVCSTNTIRLDELAKKIIQITQSNATIHFSNHTPVIFSEVVSQRLKKFFIWESKTKVENILKEYHHWLLGINKKGETPVGYG